MGDNRPPTPEVGGDGDDVMADAPPATAATVAAAGDDAAAAAAADGAAGAPAEPAGPSFLVYVLYRQHSSKPVRYDVLSDAAEPGDVKVDMLKKRLAASWNVPVEVQVIKTEAGRELKDGETLADADVASGDFLELTSTQEFSVELDEDEHEASAKRITQQHKEVMASLGADQSSDAHEMWYENRYQTGHMGLKNQGATCYLNSLVQSLFMTPEFRRLIFRFPLDYEKLLAPQKEEEDAPVDPKDKKAQQQAMLAASGQLEDEPEEGAEPKLASAMADEQKEKEAQAARDAANPRKNTIFHLQCLFARMQYCDVRAVSTSGLTRSFGWENNEVFVQHDVQELARVLLDKLEEKMRSVYDERSTEYTIRKLYKGQTINTMQCLTCKRVRGRTEDYYDLTLPIKGLASISDSLKSMCESEVMDEDNCVNCTRCGKKEPAERRVQFKSFPDVLTLHLLRFEYDWQRDMRVKVDDEIDFPDTLDVSPFLAPEDLESQLENSDDEDDGAKEEEDEAVDDDDDGSDEKKKEDEEPEVDHALGKRPTYELYAVLVHAGSAAVGHYYAYIKSYDDGRWYKYNDESVTAADAADAHGQARPQANSRYTGYGNTNSRWGSSAYRSSATPYMLVYRRVPEANVDAEEAPVAAAAAAGGVDDASAPAATEEATTTAAPEADGAAPPATDDGDVKDKKVGLPGGDSGDEAMSDADDDELNAPSDGEGSTTALPGGGDDDIDDDDDHDAEAGLSSARPGALGRSGGADGVALPKGAPEAMRSNGREFVIPSIPHSEIPGPILERLRLEGDLRDQRRAQREKELATVAVGVIRNRLALPAKKVRMDKGATLRDTLDAVIAQVKTETATPLHYRFRRVARRKNGTRRPANFYKDEDYDKTLADLGIDRKPDVYLDQHEDPEFPGISATAADTAFVQLRLWQETHPTTIRDFDLLKSMTVRELRVLVARETGLDENGFVLVEEETEEIINKLNDNDTTLADIGIINGDIIHVEPLEAAFHLNAEGQCVASRVETYFADMRNRLVCDVSETKDSLRDRIRVARQKADVDKAVAASAAGDAGDKPAAAAAAASTSAAAAAAAAAAGTAGDGSSAAATAAPTCEIASRLLTRFMDAGGDKEGVATRLETNRTHTIGDLRVVLAHILGVPEVATLRLYARDAVTRYDEGKLLKGTTGRLEQLLKRRTSRDLLTSIRVHFLDHEEHLQRGDKLIRTKLYTGMDKYHSQPIITINKNATLYDLKVAMSKHTGVDPNCIVLSEFYQEYFYRVFPSNEKLIRDARIRKLDVIRGDEMFSPDRVLGIDTRMGVQICKYMGVQEGYGGRAEIATTYPYLGTFNNEDSVFQFRKEIAHRIGVNWWNLSLGLTGTFPVQRNYLEYLKSWVGKNLTPEQKKEMDDLHEFFAVRRERRKARAEAIKAARAEAEKEPIVPGEEYTAAPGDPDSEDEPETRALLDLEEAGEDEPDEELDAWEARAETEMEKGIFRAYRENRSHKTWDFRAETLLTIKDLRLRDLFIVVWENLKIDAKDDAVARDFYGDKDGKGKNTRRGRREEAITLSI